MRYVFAAAALCAAFAHPLVAQIPWGAPIDSSVTAFVGVTVIPMDTDRVLADQTVIVSGGRIRVGEDSSAIARAARSLRVDYHVPNLLFEPFGHIPAAKSVPKESVFATVASTGICDESEAMIDFGSIHQSFQIWAIPLEKNDMVRALQRVMATRQSV